MTRRIDGVKREEESEREREREGGKLILSLANSLPITCEYLVRLIDHVIL